MECLICLNAGPEPLQENTACSCRYKRHISCWIDYVHSQSTLKCPTCRKNLAAPPRPYTACGPTVITPLIQARPQPSAPPYIPELAPIPEEPPATTPIPPPRSPNTTLHEKAIKLLKIVFVLSIIALVLVVIWVLA
jgi:hypothetical protein